MGVETQGKQLYCNTSDVAFGPKFETNEKAESFRGWWFKRKTKDPRIVSEEELRQVKQEWEDEQPDKHGWTKISQYTLPPEGVVVHTKIDDGVDCHNKQKLKLVGKMWFYTNSKMYIYYTPTHWKPL